MSKKICAVLFFKKKVYVTKETLGSSGPIEIGHLKGRIFLPKSPSPIIYDQNDNTILESPEYYNLINSVAPVKEWGHLHLGGNSGISKVMIVLEPDAMDEPNLITNTSIWLEKFHENIKLLADNFDQEISTVKQEVPLTAFYSVDGGAATRTGPLLANLSYGTRIGGGISKDQFYNSCKAASLGLELHLEYSILLKSFKAFGISDYRGSVIEAATALEISITKALRLYLTFKGVNDLNAKIKAHSMLSRLFKFAIAEGMDVAPGYAEIILIRNKVIHEGFYPTRAEVAELIEKTFNYLKTYTPDIHETS